MSNPSLIARLGLDAAEFSRGLHASESGLRELQDQAKVTAAQIALLEREMAGGGTAAQVQTHKSLQDSLRATQAEAKAAARQLAALDAVNGGRAAAALPGGMEPEAAADIPAGCRRAIRCVPCSI